MIGRNAFLRPAGLLLTAHAAVELARVPVSTRAGLMRRRGFVPGLPHALFVPVLEIAAGLGLTRSGRTATLTLSAAAATVLGAVRTGIDLEDGTVTPGTLAAAALSAVGSRAVAVRTQGAARGVLGAVIGAVVVFELARRRRVLRASADRVQTPARR